MPSFCFKPSTWAPSDCCLPTPVTSVMLSMLPIAVLLAGASAQIDPFATPSPSPANGTGGNVISFTSSPRPANFRPAFDGKAGLPFAIPDECAPHRSRQRRLVRIRTAIVLGRQVWQPSCRQKRNVRFDWLLHSAGPVRSANAGRRAFVCVRWLYAMVVCVIVWFALLADLWRKDVLEERHGLVFRQPQQW